MRVHPFQVLDVQFTSIYCFQEVRLNFYLIKLVLLMIFGKKRNILKLLKSSIPKSRINISEQPSLNPP